MHRTFAFAAMGTFTAWIALAAPAQAFTREVGPTDGNGNAQFSDPDEKVEQRLQPAPNGNGGTLRFGGDGSGSTPGFSFSIQSNERPRGAFPGDPLYRR